jgi:hypothetical protein
MAKKSTSSTVSGDMSTKKQKYYYNKSQEKEKDYDKEEDIE